VQKVGVVERKLENKSVEGRKKLAVMKIEVNLQTLNYSEKNLTEQAEMKRASGGGKKMQRKK